MQKLNKKSSFGSKVERFQGLGYHPKFEVRLGTYKYPNIFPGCYKWEKPKKIVSKIPRWERHLEIEEFSRRLGYERDNILKARKWMKSVNGPGWQEIPTVSTARDVTFSKDVRFKEAKFKAFAVPGPGTYGKNHIPHTRKEEKSREKGFSYSNVPLFEQRSCGGRNLGVYRPYHLPPNIYNVKNSIDELIAKTVSKRGPYDLFTGVRFPDKVVDKTELLPRRSYQSDWNHPKNSFKGKFLKCGKENRVTSRLVMKNPALCQKNPLDPGPNYYDPYPTLVPQQAKFPFNLSVMEARPYVKSKLLPPPGRYNAVFKKHILGDGMKSAFISKTQRRIPQPEKLSWFE